MPTTALHPDRILKMHSSFPLEKKKIKDAKTISIYFYPVRTCIPLHWDGRARSRTQHSDHKAARATGAAPARSLGWVPRTLSHHAAARGSDPALSSLEPCS